MADQWTHCQWYFQLARCDLSRGNRFDDRLSAFDDPSPPPLSLALSFSLSLPARPLPPRLQPRVTCRPFLVCIASSSPSSSRLANVHVPPSSRWLLVSTLHFSVYAANCTATARIEGRVRSSKQAGRAARQAFLPVARCGV